MERGRRDGRAAPRFGDRVRVVAAGPHLGEQGEVTSVLDVKLRLGVRQALTANVHQAFAAKVHHRVA